MIRTQRLLLRLGRAADAPLLVEHFHRNRFRLARAQPGLDPNDLKSEFFSAVRWQQHLREAAEEWSREQSLRLLMLVGQKLIGTINFTQMARGPFQACYLGYAIDGAHEGRGLMAEGLRGALAYVFDTLNFHRVMANHLPDNERSARLLQRLGFVTEGRAEHYLLIQGEWQPHVLTALTNRNWRLSEIS